ncbi:MAG: hypothetical protein QXD86_06850 [Candidatus Bathyarchaeia archaeon]
MPAETVPRRVRVVAKRVKGGRYRGYVVTIPTAIARMLGIEGGEVLGVKVVEARVGRRRVKAILYYMDAEHRCGLTTES